MRALRLNNKLNTLPNISHNIDHSLIDYILSKNCAFSEWQAFLGHFVSIISLKNKKKKWKLWVLSDKRTIKLVGISDKPNKSLFFNSPENTNPPLYQITSKLRNKKKSTESSIICKHLLNSLSSEYPSPIFLHRLSLFVKKCQGDFFRLPYP